MSGLVGWADLLFLVVSWPLSATFHLVFRGRNRWQLVLVDRERFVAQLFDDDGVWDDVLVLFPSSISLLLPLLSLGLAVLNSRSLRIIGRIYDRFRCWSLGNTGRSLFDDWLWWLLFGFLLNHSVNRRWLIRNDHIIFHLTLFISLLSLLLFLLLLVLRFLDWLTLRVFLLVLQQRGQFSGQAITGWVDSDSTGFDERSSLGSASLSYFQEEGHSFHETSLVGDDWR